jgi:hypothetical protein
MANDTLTRTGKLSLALESIENHISVIAAMSGLMERVFVQGGSNNSEEYNDACELFDVIDRYAAEAINEIAEAGEVVDALSRDAIKGNI